MKRIILVLGLAATTAQAQDSTEQDISYKAVTTIDMVDVGLKGDLITPELTAVAETRRPVFAPMIKLREDFKKESKESLLQIQ